ncbi:MAG: RNA 2'-phosphotransferase [Ardenticatenia bacterium]|nr:RNA 2'-phosphotransferase [Ardenticatenia bacterium]
MTNTQRRRLSKLMSYLLRHRPEEAGLTLDAGGMVPLEALLAAIRQRRGYGWVTEDHIRDVVATSKPPRFRLEGDRIGARYGHSRRVREIDPGEPVEPPEILYHGTSRRAVPSILASGLHPRGRQFVHLSATREAALRVGRRHDPQPAVLIIHARKAHADGLTFYAPTPEVYLVRRVSPEYIEMEQ